MKLLPITIFSKFFSLIHSLELDYSNDLSEQKDYASNNDYVDFRRPVADEIDHSVSIYDFYKIPQKTTLESNVEASSIISSTRSMSDEANTFSTDKNIQNDEEPSNSRSYHNLIAPAENEILSDPTITRKIKGNSETNTKLFLIGPSGSGKSTLGNFLIGEPNTQNGLFKTGNLATTTTNQYDYNKNVKYLFGNKAYKTKIKVYDLPSYDRILNLNLDDPVSDENSQQVSNNKSKTTISVSRKKDPLPGRQLKKENKQKPQPQQPSTIKTLKNLINTNFDNNKVGFLIILNNDNRRIDSTIQNILSDLHSSLHDDFWRNSIFILTRIENFKDESSEIETKEVFLDKYRESMGRIVYQIYQNILEKTNSDGKTSRKQTQKQQQARQKRQNNYNSEPLDLQDIINKIFYLDAQFEKYLDIFPFPPPEDIEWKILTTKQNREEYQFMQAIKNLSFLQDVMSSPAEVSDSSNSVMIQKMQKQNQDLKLDLQDVKLRYEKDQNIHTRTINHLQNKLEESEKNLIKDKNENERVIVKIKQKYNNKIMELEAKIKQLTEEEAKTSQQTGKTKTTNNNKKPNTSLIFNGSKTGTSGSNTKKENEQTSLKVTTPEVITKKVGSNTNQKVEDNNNGNNNDKSKNKTKSRRKNRPGLRRYRKRKNKQGQVVTKRYKRCRDFSYTENKSYAKYCRSALGNLKKDNQITLCSKIWHCINPNIYWLGSVFCVIFSLGAKGHFSAQNEKNDA